MARLLRVWEKKRGKRRTGSKLVGTVGEILFFAALFAAGAVALAALLTSEVFKPGFGFWVMVLVVSSFMLLGSGGVLLTLFHAGASPERRSALVKRAAQIDLRADAAAARPSLPNMPSDTNFINSPGVKLRYRLPVSQSSSWRLVLAGVFCLIWNTSAVLLVAVAANSFRAQRPEWFLTIFAIPFVMIGGWSVYDFVRQWLLFAGTGPTTLEISNHPLRPGRTYTVALSQAGRIGFQSLAVHLVCEESATYRQGTDIRTEQRRRFDRQLCRRTQIRIDPGKPFEYEFPLHMPEDAMHSFQSEHNAVNWMLVVHGQAEAWPPFERCFPLLVYPQDDGNQTAD